MDEVKESRFTKPSNHCPHPEYWTSHDSDSTEFEVIDMIAGLVRGLQPDFVIETGSAFGFGSAAIGAALEANGHGNLHSIELNAKRVAIARVRTARYRQVDILQGSSMDYTPALQPDFVFFDSLFELRAKEFRKYYPFMKPTTIVAFHDTGPQHPLRPDIEQLAEEGLITPIFLPTPRGICIAEVHKND